MKREARVNQSCLKADIWVRVECSNTIHARSKGQHNQLRYARVAHVTGGTRMTWRVARGHRFILGI